ncbi:MAG: membrane protein insertion efficiency factor YidD [Bacteroidetes bacterium]|nr:membrane protein insertion efficiency factor YidD [Bacteroidota bacterium]
MQQVSNDNADERDADVNDRSVRLLEQNAGPLRRTLAGIIRLYQRYISPLAPPSCRFHPTCSEYTRQAILKYGALKGIRLGVVRILKCHPFHPGGFDPVP